jgi:hypothetical protein
VIRLIDGRRMQCKDISDEVFLAALRRVPGSANCGWRNRWAVHAELEAVVGPVPERLMLAKARRLIARGLMKGCACGCRGDWQIKVLEAAQPMVDVPCPLPKGHSERWACDGQHLGREEASRG